MISFSVKKVYKTTFYRILLSIDWNERNAESSFGDSLKDGAGSMFLPHRSEENILRELA